MIAILFFVFYFGRKVYIFKKNEKIKAQIEKERLLKEQIENDPAFQQVVNDMKTLVTIITSIPEHYLTADERIDIKKQIESILKNIASFHIKKDYYGYPEYYTLKVAQVDILTKLQKLNEIFIKETLEKHKELFDNIDGKSLDKQQRVAIVTDESHNLIIAGAGSGKTLTILGKVAYLLKCGISPQEMLLIAFTRKAAGELEERINRDLSLGIKAQTFHKLGLDIITSNNKERPDIDDKFETYLEDYFSKELIQHRDDVQDFLEFIGYYLNIPIELTKDGTLGEKIEKEKNADLETLSEKYNRIIADEKKTIKGERVKSLEELIIANFLFLNGVEYEYEREYPHQSEDKTWKRYRPDFYIKDFDIYLEHFGIDKNGKCQWLSEIEEKKYIDGINWKREIHKTNSTKLIETYSYFQTEGKLLINLKNLLLENNIKLSPITSDKMLLLVKEIQTENANKEFIKLCGTFIKLFKSNGYDESFFATMKEKFSNTNIKNYFNQFNVARTLHFLSIVEKIYFYYQARLSQNKTIDFSDMINNAAKIVQENGIFPYKYIIIDEYQDIGMDRYKLIKAIIEKTSARLMCVGDDWQSIYRFAGSDANLIMQFSKYWGETQISKIENTYRNSQELINIASRFVMKNPNQIKKTLQSQKSCKNPICLYYYNKNDFNVVLEKLFDYIVKDYGENTNILLLSRTNNDIELLKTGVFIIKNDTVICKKHKQLKIQFLTVHKSKGLEADNVIILNMKNDKLGFPNKIADDPILQLFLSSEDNFAFAEERRLFYVALTRTRNKTFLLVPDHNASEFANEIKTLCHSEIPGSEKLIINNPKCPRCKTGQLVIRQANDKQKSFVGCSNYPACDFTNNDTSIITNPIKCPRCGGFLVIRKGKHGQFLGCTNYPDYCRYTAHINNFKPNKTKHVKVHDTF
jgi:DNA helicase-4